VGGVIGAGVVAGGVAGAAGGADIAGDVVNGQASAVAGARATRATIVRPLSGVRVGRRRRRTGRGSWFAAASRPGWLRLWPGLGGGA